MVSETSIEVGFIPRERENKKQKKKKKKKDCCNFFLFSFIAGVEFVVSMGERSWVLVFYLLVYCLA